MVDPELRDIANTPKGLKELLEQYGGIRQLARATGLSFGYIYKRVEQWGLPKGKWGGNRREAKEKPKPEKPLPTYEEVIDKKKEQLQEKHHKAIFDKLLKERTRTEMICETVEQAISILPPMSPPRYERIKTKCDDEEAVLLISDCQVGQIVDPEETGLLGNYDLDVFRQMSKHLAHSVRKITGIHSRAYNVPRLNIFMLGDIVENETIFRGQKDYIDADVVSQMFIASEELCSTILEIAQDYEQVKINCVIGNHGRTGQKGEGRTWVNWDYVAYKFMAEKLRNQKNIEWVIPKAWWQLVNVQGFNFLLLHGDDIKGWNSIPYYGIDRSDARWTKLLQANGKSFDYLVMGHHHNQAQIDSPVGEKIINGCWPGGSQFSLKTLNVANKPSQLFFGVHPRQGITWRYKIGLEAEA